MDPREFTDAAGRRAWNDGAEAWDRLVEAGADFYRLEVHGPRCSTPAAASPAS